MKRINKEEHIVGEIEQLPGEDVRAVLKKMEKELNDLNDHGDIPSDSYRELIDYLEQINDLV